MDRFAEIEAKARARKTGFRCDFETVGAANEAEMLEMLRWCGGTDAVPDMMKSLGYPYSVEKSGLVDAFEAYLTKNKLTTDWAQVMGRVYFTRDEDAVMAQLLL